MDNNCKNIKEHTLQLGDNIVDHKIIKLCLGELPAIIIEDYNVYTMLKIQNNT